MAQYSRPTILNVDDNEGCRYAVTRILELNDFTVKEARTGAEVIGAYWEKLFSSFSDLSVAVSNTMVDGNRVALFARVTTNDRFGVFGVPVTSGAITYRPGDSAGGAHAGLASGPPRAARRSDHRRLLLELGRRHPVDDHRSGDDARLPASRALRRVGHRLCARRPRLLVED